MRAALWPPLVVTLLLAIAAFACGEGDDGCQPDCTGRVCGPDGCGGFCGICGAGRCVEGACEMGCSCAGRECGDDGCGVSCGECSQGVCLVSGVCGGCTPGSPVCSGRDVRVCGQDGLTSDLVRQCNRAPFDDRCVLCPMTGEATCAAAAPVCEGSLSGLAGEVSIASDSTCGDTGCELQIVAGSQVVLTIAQVQLTLTGALSQVPSGVDVALNAQPGGQPAPIRISARPGAGMGRCDNDAGTTVRANPAPGAGRVRLTRAAGEVAGAPIRVEVLGHLSCDEGSTWVPLGIDLDMVVTDSGG